MAISSSLATKVGAAGAVTAGGGLAGTYFAWDHITLYEVEREVINNDFKLTVSDPTDGNKKIIIEAPKSTDASANPKLKEGYSWTCEITVEPKSGDTTSFTNLGKYIKSHLQVPEQALTNSQRKNKEMLVKTCAKSGKRSSKQVTGKLILKAKEGSTTEFTFQDHKHLDFLLTKDTSLYSVEEEVISRKVTLTAEKASDSESKVTVKAAINTSDSNTETSKLLHGHSWTCEITTLGQGETTGNDATDLNSKLTTLLKSISDKNRELLVKECSKDRIESSNDKSVVGQLKVTVTGNGPKTYSFKGHTELDVLFTTK